MINADENLEGLEGKTLGFFAREKPDFYPWDTRNKDADKSTVRLDSLFIKILRPLYFFHSEQAGITLGKLREFFTEKAIILFEKDGYIKILEAEEETAVKGCNIQK